MTKSFIICIISRFPLTLIHFLVKPTGSLNILNIGYLHGDINVLEKQKYIFI